MRQRDPEKARKIRQSALEMLVLDGFDAFSMQKLAKAAGVSPATLYIYFEDRDDLIYQLWQEQSSRWGDLVLEDFAAETPFEQELWRRWQLRIRFFLAHPLEWQFIQQVMHTPLIHGFMERNPALRGNAMWAFFTRCAARGELTDFGLGKALGQKEGHPREAFWALAYAPLIAMLRWRPDRTKPLHESPAQVDMQLIEKMFACVVKGLRP